MRLPRLRSVVALAHLGLAACASLPTSQPTEAARHFDLILRGGTIVDGTGRPAYRADVGITASSIAAIGDLSGASSTTTVDVSGLVVSPGFINLHSHASALSTAENMLRQGVTTEMVNPDGGGPIDIARQLVAAESASLAVNVGAYAPFNSVWTSVVGNSDRRPPPDEIERMRALLVQAMEAGAWGVSAGLDYKPAYFATTDEVVAVLEPLRRWRTNFPNHDRLMPEHGYSSLAAMRETIEIGERAGLVPVITHMKLQGREQGRVGEAAAMMRAASARGVYTVADVYPYLAGQTGLAALFVPGWALDGGRPKFLERVRDVALRPRIVRETEEALAARVGTAANIFVIGRNKTLAQLMTELGTTSPGDAIMRILEVDSPGMIATFGAESDLVGIMQYPDAAIACDCGASRGGAHPRGFGSFPRVLGRYVRGTRALALEDAVRKMTGLPATIVGMVDRGFLAVGMAADVTVFDSATVIDHATYERPNEFSDGIKLVVVNGNIALRDGLPTGVTAGRALRRTGNMPSRAMSVTASQRVATRDDGILIDVSQAPSDRTASGNVRIALDGGATFQSTGLGLLQTTKGWASVTGRGRVSPSGEERAFVLVIEDADPFAPNRSPTVRIQIEGRSELRRYLTVSSR
jgi:N-acyl-D-amino-acid deacylase